MIKLASIASAVAIMAASAASAADLPTHKAPPAYSPAPYATTAYNWTGFYVGVNGGYGIGGADAFGHPDGGLVGGTVGYNYQIGQFVLGAEGDWDFADLNHNNSNALANYHIRQDDIVTLRARAGVALDRTLLYATGGYAGVHESGSYFDPLTGFNGSESHWRNGGAIGVGAEYAFTNNISAKAEYLYLPLSSKSYFSGTPYAASSGSDSLFRVGLNYKF
jgi:outer membrane immunogenic protein